MGLFDKVFGRHKALFEKEKGLKNESAMQAKDNSIVFQNNGSITSGSEYVGRSENDFYVYEWFVKETGEIFYVGKGCGNRYKEYHEREYEAEKIRELFETDCRFVGKNLSEDEALNLETSEIMRILNETNDRLTNRIIPFFTKRDNGYSRAPGTPELQFEKAPVLYASEIEEHYYGTKWRNFDRVSIECLGYPAILDKVISSEEKEIIYGGNYEKYYSEVILLLEKNGSKVLKSEYAKSVSAWIYPFDDYVLNHDIAEETAKEKLGRYIPTYHLIDVWKELIKIYGQPEIKTEKIIINPNNNRVPLSRIMNLHNWDKGFDAGYKYWERGEVERKAGNITEAIKLFDEARYKGYFAPALYNSYAMAYRKVKDLENEIEILDEAINRFRSEKCDNSQIIIKYEEQKKKAISKLSK